MDTNFIKKVALSGLILGVAFTATVPSYAAENATVVITEDGKKKSLRESVKKHYIFVAEPL